MIVALLPLNAGLKGRDFVMAVLGAGRVFIGTANWYLFRNMRWSLD